MKENGIQNTADGMVSGIAMYLRNLRHNSGLTVSKVAEYCGVSYTYISLVENGRVLPSFKILIKLGSLYNIALDELLAVYLRDAKVIRNKLETSDIDDIIKIRISNLYPLLFSKFSEMTGEEMLEELEKKFPERFELLYQKAKKEIGGEQLDKYEAIKNWLVTIPSITEMLRSYMKKDVPEAVSIAEMIIKTKKLLGWDWERVGIEFGVTGRTVQRWVKGTCEIPEKARNRIFFLYNVICKRIEETVKPLQHLYKGTKSSEADVIMNEMEKLGLEKEIKERFCKKYPELKKHKKKKLNAFFLEFSKKHATFKEIMRNRPLKLKSKKTLNRNVTNCSNKNYGRENTSSGRKGKKEISSNDANESEGESDYDLWVRKDIKNAKIQIAGKVLFENLERKIVVARIRGDLLEKGVSMKLRKRSESPYYYLDICLNGVRVRMSTRTTSKREAEAIAALIHYNFWRKQKLENLSVLKVPTFEEESARFIEYQRKKGLVSLTREQECHRALVPYLGKITVDQISPVKIQESLEKIKEEKPGISPRTLDYYRGYLHRFFQYEKNIVTNVKENPVEKVPRFKFDNRRSVILTQNDEVTFLNSIEDPVVKDIVRFVLLTGLRQGEALNIRKENLIVDNGLTYLKIKREKNNLVTEFPIVGDQLRQIVNRYYSAQGDNFFSYPDGQPITKWKMIYEFQKARKKSGIKNLCFHDLRRTFYTRMKLAGCDYLILEYLMGHILPQISSRYFAYTVKDIAQHLDELAKKNVPLLSQ